MEGINSAVLTLLLFCTVLLTTTMSVVGSTISRFAQSEEYVTEVYAAGVEMSLSTFGNEENMVSQIINLGATNDINGNYKIYPGQSGMFQVNINFCSDILAEIYFSNTIVEATGAFAYAAPSSEDIQNYTYSEENAIDNTKLRFFVTDDVAYFNNELQIDWDEDGVKFKDFKEELLFQLQKAFGNNFPVYTDLGFAVNEKIYVYWNWDNTNTTEKDDLIDSYLLEKAVEEEINNQTSSDISVSITLNACQITPEVIETINSDGTIKYVNGYTGNPSVDWVDNTETVDGVSYFKHYDEKLGKTIYYNSNTGIYGEKISDFITELDINYGFIYSEGIYGQR